MRTNTDENHDFSSHGKTPDPSIAHSSCFVFSRGHEETKKTSSLLSRAIASGPRRNVTPSKLDDCKARKKTFERCRTRRTVHFSSSKKGWEIRMLHEQNLYHQVFCIFRILNFHLNRRRYRQIRLGRSYAHRAKYARRRIIMRNIRDRT